MVNENLITIRQSFIVRIPYFYRRFVFADDFVENEGHGIFQVNLLNDLKSVILNPWPLKKFLFEHQILSSNQVNPRFFFPQNITLTGRFLLRNLTP